jgi:hypothetical protein
MKDYLPGMYLLEQGILSAKCIELTGLVLTGGNCETAFQIETTLLSHRVKNEHGISDINQLT